jgi:hypothetical protein
MPAGRASDAWVRFHSMTVLSVKEVGTFPLPDVPLNDFRQACQHSTRVPDRSAKKIV